MRYLMMLLLAALTTLSISATPADAQSCKIGNLAGCPSPYYNVVSSNDAVSVMAPAYGARCDGITDDTASIQNALNSGFRHITIPAGKQCYSATGITIPAGVALDGLSYDPRSTVASNPGTGSTIVCAANINCVATTPLGTATIRSLSITTNNPNTPTAGACLYVNNSYSVTVSQVYFHNCYDGQYLFGYVAGNNAGGLGAHEDQIIEDFVSDAFIVMDTWPEFYLHNGRMGKPGSEPASDTYIRMEGGNANQLSQGPNTLQVTGVQFNANVTNAFEFVNCRSVGACSNSSFWQFDNIHVEGVTGSYFYSDATWPLIQRLMISASGFNSSTPHFFSLNPATGVNSVEIAGSFIACSDMTLSPATAVIKVDMAADSIACSSGASFTSNTGLSTLSASGIEFLNGLTVAGAWDSVFVAGGDMGAVTTSGVTSGDVTVLSSDAPKRISLVNGTGPLIVNVPIGTASQDVTDFLQPNLATGNQTAIRVGTTGAVGYGAATLSYEANATPNQSLSCLGLTGAAMQLCARGDGVISLNGPTVAIQIPSAIAFDLPSGQTTTQDAGDFLQPGLAAGNRTAIRVGTSAGTGNAAVVLSFIPNATANQSVGCMGVTGGETILCARGDGPVLIQKLSSAPSTAPGAGFVSLFAVAGSNSGSCKLQAEAGTSATPVTIVDNIGSGC